MSARTVIGRLLAVVLVLGCTAGAAPTVMAEQQKPEAAQDEFLPIDELPPEERLPAAPFLIAAYSAAWIIVAVYLWSIRQRIRRVERELGEVARRVQSRGGPPPNIAESPRR